MIKGFTIIAAIFVICTAPFSLLAQKHLWGMCRSKGTVKGTIFKTDSAGNNYTDVYTFNTPANGIEPYGSLVQAPDGNLYGMTAEGGTGNHGVIFRINPTTGNYTKLYDFDSLNGKRPYGSLCAASNGKLYGMTYEGGSNMAYSKGVLFEYDPYAYSFTKKLDLLTKYVVHPYGSLIQGADGKLYGMAKEGGGDATGILFNYDYITETFTYLMDFYSGPQWHGYHPLGSLVEAGDGSFYGFSQYGAAWGNGGGVIFKYDPAGPILSKMSSVHKFSELLPTSVQGYGLSGTPLLATNGKLYGMTNKGGTDSAGTIFEMDVSTGIVQKLYDFDSANNGYAPYGSLMQASDGMLYGLTTSEQGQARLFRFNILTNTLIITAAVTGTPMYTMLIETDASTTGMPSADISAKVHVYPNPAVNSLRIIAENIFVPGRMIITDAYGRQLLSKPLKQDNLINISHLPAAIYTLRLTDRNNKTLMKKFVVTR